MISSLTRRLALLLMLASTAACGSGKGLDGAWEQYLARLENVLDRQPQAVAPPGFPFYPRKRSLALTFSANDIDLLDFLRLRRCALGETLAQRNSILGRHGDASSRLIFDLLFLSQVDACIAQLEEDERSALQAALRQAKASKQRELPARIFAASLGGAEFRELWAHPSAQRPYPPEGDDQSVAALAQWRSWQQQWLQGNWQIESEALLNTLGEIRLGLGGKLLQAQQQNYAGLEQARSVIQARLTGRPLCLKGATPPAAQHFRTVLSQFFIADVQAQASRINRHQQQLMAPIQQLENELFAAMSAAGTPPPPAYLQWRQRRDRLLEDVTQAHRRHVQAAGELLEQCGLAPGRQASDTIEDPP